MYNRTYTGKIELAVLDTAGTFCDGPGDLRNRWPKDDLRGCKAPVVPFYEALQQFGIECDWAEIRKPMGAFKPTHLRMLLNLPEISAQWEEKYGRPWNEDDFDAVLAAFRPLMSKYIVDEDLAKPIPGAVECIDKLRAAGILVGCDTGYYAEDSAALNKLLEEKFGMKFDVVTNAGVWTIGLYASGSNNYDQLAAAKPDFLVPDVSYVPEIIFGQIEPRLRRGERPGQGIIETI